MSLSVDYTQRNQSHNIDFKIFVPEWKGSGCTVERGHTVYEDRDPKVLDALQSSETIDELKDKLYPGCAALYVGCEWGNIPVRYVQPFWKVEEEKA